MRLMPALCIYQGANLNYSGFLLEGHEGARIVNDSNVKAKGSAPSVRAGKKRGRMSELE